MLELSGYSFDEQIHHGARNVVYRGSADDGQAVVVKVPHSAHPSRLEVARLFAEYEIGQAVEHPAVVSYLAIEESQLRPVLVMADIGGTSLRKSLGGRPLAPTEFFKLAIPLAEGLAELHRNRVIHKDINPDNIVLNRDSGQVQFVDLGLASILSREKGGLDEARLEGTLRYIAPEQTGRTNRFVDYRSDFYSLGVTFYEMLSGAPPFASDDPLELVHAHLARTPTPLHQVEPQVGEALSAVVNKLMMKSAEARYQSVEGLLWDLALCRDGLTDPSKLEDFVAGAQDVSHRLQFPSRPYGREEELKALQGAWMRARDGSRAFVAVGGSAGAGKSALAEELQWPVLADDGWFVWGKFDQYNRDLPYSAVIAAVQSLVRQALVLPPERVEALQAQLETTLEGMGRVLIDAIPDIELLIGEQPDAAELPASEAEQRFTKLMRRFFRAFASRQHPLVLFIDDLQWVDAGTLKLLEVLLGDEDLTHLLLIGAYRADEVQEAHPLSLMIGMLERHRADLTRISLGGLDLTALNSLLNDTLHASAEEVGQLAQLLLRKTRGNPFFVRQMLRSWEKEGLLRFSSESRGFRWDSAELEASSASDNVVQLLLTQMELLPEYSREVLEQAACIGNRFDLGMLSVFSGSPLDELFAGLQRALDEGIVRVLDARFSQLLLGGGDGLSMEELHEAAFSFAHDRFQQAAYQRIPEDKRGALHRRLADLMLEHFDDEAVTEHVFEIAGHYSAGESSITSPEDRLKVARIYERAAERAERGAAFEQSLGYAQDAIRLLGPDGWQVDYPLMRSLYRIAIEACVLNIRFNDTGMELSKVAVEYAKPGLDQAHFIAGSVMFLARNREPDAAFQLALPHLKAVGIELDVPDPEAHALELYREVEEKLAGITEVDQLPEADEQTATALQLLRCSMFPLYMVRRDLVTVGEIYGLKMMLEGGVTPLAGTTWAAAARVVAHVFGDYGRGFELVELAKQVADRMGAYRVAAYGLSAAFVEWVKRPLPEVVDRLIRGFRIGVEEGETFFAGLCASFVSAMGFAAGLPLDRLRSDCAPLTLYIQRNMGDLGAREIDLTLRAIDVLKGERDAMDMLFDTQDEADRALEVMAERNQEGLFWYWLLRSRLALLAGQANEALTFVDNATGVTDTSLGVFATYDVPVYEGLAAAYADLDSDQRMERLARCERLLAERVEAGLAVNFRHRHALVHALRVAADGEELAAAKAFDRAVQLASAERDWQLAGLANECAARFYYGIDLSQVGHAYMREAIYCYQQWGAPALVTRLTNAFPEAATTHAHVDQTHSSTSGTQFGSGEFLDFSALANVLRAISGEMALGAVVETTLRTLTESAGATRAVLCLIEDERLVAKSEFDPSVGRLRPIEQPLAECRDLPVGIVRYAARTKEAVVLDDASRHGDFQHDAYVREHKLKSVLCQPLVLQGQLSGVAYLENTLGTRAFHRERADVVEMLSAQAAISIDNARLYEEVEQSNRKLADYSANLEQKVAERTQDLADKNSQLSESLEAQKQMQDRLLISEKMASLGNLVAGVAHEINTPLGAVVSSVDTAMRASGKIQQAWDKAESIEALRSGRAPKFLKMIDDSHQLIRTAGERVSEIVRTLRNFARLDEADRKSADLHEGLESTLQLIRHRVKRGIELERDYGDLPEVHCHPNQINQVFMNVLNNAVDAIEELRAQDPEYAGLVKLHTHTDGDHVVVEIRDNGPGIDEETRARVFDPGFTTKGVGVGTGLGLAIVMRIINDHHGTISVASTKGEGTAVTIRLPVGTPSS